MLTRSHIQTLLFALLLVSVKPQAANAQAPEVIWENTIGGFSGDEGFSICQTSDNGYILAGYSSSGIAGDKTDYIGGFDVWVVKLDSAGTIQWDNVYGGTAYEYDYFLQARCVITTTPDGGYLLGASSQSGISGNKTEANIAGTYDLWILKLDAGGNIQWQNTIGGAGDDYLFSLEAMEDGGCLIGASSDSPLSADKTEPSWGGYDYWVLRLDADGDIVWQNTIGGDQSDILGNVFQTVDGSLYAVGESTSGIVGDKSEGSALGDYWIVKLDSEGNVIWDITLGGLSSDVYPRGVAASDLQIVVAGMSLSGAGLDKSEPQIGVYDYWVLRISPDGDVMWDKTIGGGNYDYAGNICSTSDNGFIVGGYSNSGISGSKSEAAHGGVDYWLVKINELGNIVWQKTIGGWDDEILSAVIQTSDMGFAIMGHSQSEASFEKTEDYIGFAPNPDYWVVRLAPDSCYSSIEVCNGLDDDCNGVIDDSFIYTTYYADTDGDAFGDISSTTSTCTGFAPEGYVSDSTDCDDANALIFPGATELCNGFDDNCNVLIDEGLTWYNYYLDNDADGFGDNDGWIILCTALVPVGYVTDSSDCNDDASLIFPGAVELCNALDDDCDALFDEGYPLYVYFYDGDADGFGDPDMPVATCLFPAPENYVEDNTDCDDSNYLLHEPALYYLDADGDLYGDADAPEWICALTAPAGYSLNDQDCNDLEFLINPGSNEICNALDDDCDVLIDEGLPVYTLYADADGDGFGDVNNPIALCQPLSSGYVSDSSDCDDTNPYIYPGAEEILNGIDDDCDTLVDEGVTSIFENDLLDEVIIFPNPASNEINLQFSGPLPDQIQIRNAIGQIMFTPDMISNHLHINISDWPSGVYFVEVIALSAKYMKQFVK